MFLCFNGYEKKTKKPLNLNPVERIPDFEKSIKGESLDCLPPCAKYTTLFPKIDGPAIALLLQQMLGRLQITSEHEDNSIWGFIGSKLFKGKRGYNIPSYMIYQISIIVQDEKKQNHKIGLISLFGCNQISLELNCIKYPICGPFNQIMLQQLPKEMNRVVLSPEAKELLMIFLIIIKSKRGKLPPMDGNNATGRHE